MAHRLAVEATRKAPVNSARTQKVRADDARWWMKGDPAVSRGSPGLEQVGISHLPRGSLR